MDDFWGAYMPNWISAISTALALVAAAAAAVFAWRTWQHEATRDERAEAMGLSAWWVVIRDAESERWGVIVNNAAQFTFHDVEISTEGNNNPKAAAPVVLRTLVPGRCFIESRSRKATTAWDIGANLPTHADLTPLSSSQKHRIVELRFTDASGRRWAWNPDRGYARVSVRRGAGERATLTERG